VILSIFQKTVEDRARWIFSNSCQSSNFSWQLDAESWLTFFSQVPWRCWLFIWSDVQAWLSNSKILSYFFQQFPNFHKALNIRIFSMQDNCFSIYPSRQGWCMGSLDCLSIFQFAPLYPQWCFHKNLVMH